MLLKRPRLWQSLVATTICNIAYSCSPFDMESPPRIGVLQGMASTSGIDYQPPASIAQRARGHKTSAHRDWKPESIAFGASSTSPITDASELSCSDFDSACRWRNVDGLFVDELDWFQGTGTIDRLRIQSATGSDLIPDGSYAIVATDAVQAKTAKAVLAADQIPCQIGAGLLSFMYWTSPDVRVRVCMKKTSKAFLDFDFCSDYIEVGDPGPAYVTIPEQPSSSFQIFIIADNFIFDSVDLKGGFAILDNIKYTAEICSDEEQGKDSVELFSPKAAHSLPVDNGLIGMKLLQTSGFNSIPAESSRALSQPTIARNTFRNTVVHRVTRPPVLSSTTTSDEAFTTKEESHPACQVLTCQFNDFHECSQSLTSSSSWRLSSHAIGNPLTGIRGDASMLPFNEGGSFAFLSGPVDFSRMLTRPFYLDRHAYFVFSYHKVDRSSLLRLYKKRSSSREEHLIFEAPRVNKDSRRWFREGVRLEKGDYEYIAFEVRNLTANDYIGIDELLLVDTMRQNFCPPD